MIKKLYSIQDMKAETFSPPFLADTNASAVRMVTQAVQGGNAGLLSSNPEDHRLFYVGEFNISDGELLSPVAPELVMDLTFLNSKKDA